MRLCTCSLHVTAGKCFVEHELGLENRTVSLEKKVTCEGSAIEISKVRLITAQVGMLTDLR